MASGGTVGGFEAGGLDMGVRAGCAASCILLLVMLLELLFCVAEVESPWLAVLFVVGCNATASGGGEAGGRGWLGARAEGGWCMEI